MVHAKNYETVSKSVKIMPEILWPLFFGTWCIKQRRNWNWTLMV